MQDSVFRWWNKESKCKIFTWISFRTAEKTWRTLSPRQHWTFNVNTVVPHTDHSPRISTEDTVLARKGPMSGELSVQLAVSPTKVSEYRAIWPAGSHRRKLVVIFSTTWRWFSLHHTTSKGIFNSTKLTLYHCLTTVTSTHRPSHPLTVTAASPTRVKSSPPRGRHTWNLTVPSFWQWKSNCWNTGILFLWMI